jgi:hypothetical protein
MALEKFMHKPSDEYELFTKISQEVSENFNYYHGEYFYIHLSKASEQTSVADEIKSSKDSYEIGHHLYVERDKQACILIRSEDNSIGLLLHGEFDWAENVVHSNRIQVLTERQKSILPGIRRSKLSAVERMQAFGLIEESLQESKRKIS